ncbi:Hsp70 family protein [Streptomyces europaeiscabiei]|uniref:Hsp70 family protein n=1 Tax=Streptomyces europaeiscabiei TaxID=146819 RepID=UPI0038F7B1F0
MTAPRRTGASGHEIGLGLDFGSTGLRAAFGRPGGSVRRLTPSASYWPWLLCEPAVTGPLPVTFPSLKSRLGSGRAVLVGDARTTPDELVTRMLRELREQVEAAASGRIAQTVVSVPVGYRSAQRAALLDAARAAGLTEVRLIGDAMAAVIGHTAGRGSSTCLVYGLGYGGFELGLIRGARGRYRALGHETASSTGGRAFDEAALTAVARTVRDRTDPDGLDEADWLGLRARVQEIRERLGAPGGDDSAVLETALGGSAERLRFDRDQQEAFLDRHVRRTLGRAHTLLDQSGMAARDVDTLLLVGGGTRLEQVRAGARGLGRTTVRASADLLALGALMHASRLAGLPPSGLDGLALESEASDDTLADSPRLSVTLLSGPAVTDGAPLDIARARELVARGQVTEARALLEAVVAEARALLDALDAPGPVDAAEPSGLSGPSRSAESAHPADQDAARLLSAARDLLTQGRYDRAVRTAHAAWQAAHDGASGPDLLDAMIHVHCAAAMADSSPEHFTDAYRWLRCAYDHDPTNTRVRELLAERTYRHADRLHGRGRRDEAVEALRQCLAWNPEHGSAQDLLERLGRHGRNHGARGGVPR